MAELDEGTSNARGPYAGGIARREKILEVTDQLLAEVGFHGLSMRDVARRVGISHPGVIYHFPSKEALLMAVIERHEGRFDLDVSDVTDISPKQLLRMFMDKCAQCTNEPKLIEMEYMLSVEASSKLHPAHDHFLKRNNALVNAARISIEMMKRDNIVDEGIDSEQMALQMVSLSIGVHLLWLYNRESMPEPRVVIMQALLGFLNLQNPETLRMVLSMGVISRSLIETLEAALDKTILEMIHDRDFVVDADFLGSYGLEKLPIELVHRVIDSGIFTAEYAAYASSNRAISLELLGKLVVGGVIDKIDLQLLRDNELVSSDVIDTLAPIAVERSEHRKDDSD